MKNTKEFEKLIEKACKVYVCNDDKKAKKKNKKRKQK